jgi:hypothetical protein
MARNGRATPWASSPRFIVVITMVNHHKGKKVHLAPKQETSLSAWVLSPSKYILYSI